MSDQLVTYIMFTIVWCILSGIPSTASKLLFTIFIPLINLLLSIKLNLSILKDYFKTSSIMYFLWILKEILISSISVVKIVWTKSNSSLGVIISLQTIQTKDIGLLTYANSITLTPGTITLCIESKKLIVHALNTSFMIDLQAGNMDKKIKNILK